MAVTKIVTIIGFTILGLLCLLLLICMVCCHIPFTHAVNKVHCILLILTLVWTNQWNYSENALHCSKHMQNGRSKHTYECYIQYVFWSLSNMRLIEARYLPWPDKNCRLKLWRNFTCQNGPNTKQQAMP
jgi:hypothetical protein